MSEESAALDHALAAQAIQPWAASPRLQKALVLDEFVRAAPGS